MQQLKVSLFDLVMGLSHVADLISPAVANHHRHVAYISAALAAELGLPANEQRDLVLAAALHDIGCLTLQDRLDSLQLAAAPPYGHCERGGLLLQDFPALAAPAELIRFQRVAWRDGAGATFLEQAVPLGSHILHLADRVAARLKRPPEVDGQVGPIVAQIEADCGALFVPELVEAFKSLAAKECFWLDIAAPEMAHLIRERVRAASADLEAGELLSLARVFARIVDFRSSFTASHSSGVAASATALAKAVGFSRQECHLVAVAAYLHDIGKLAVPPEIVEKPGELTEQERQIVRSHPYYTFHTLRRCGLQAIAGFAALHHERLDGNGYPFHIGGDDLSLGARIMAVADVFTAITADRPYRWGMTKDEALRVLHQMVVDSILDPALVALLTRAYDEISAARLEAQAPQATEYSALIERTAGRAAIPGD